MDPTGPHIDTVRHSPICRRRQQQLPHPHAQGLLLAESFHIPPQPIALLAPLVWLAPLCCSSLARLAPSNNHTAQHSGRFTRAIATAPAPARQTAAATAGTRRSRCDTARALRVGHSGLRWLSSPAPHFTTNSISSF